MAERRKHLILVGLILATLVGVALLAVPSSPIGKKPVLGLDLQGGLEVVLRAVPPEGRPLRENDLNRSVEIIRNRVDKIGVAEPEIATQGDDQIAIQLPGVENADRARELIGQTAQLELFDLETSLVGPSISAQLFPVSTDNLYDLLVSAGTKALVEKNGQGSAHYLFERKTKKLVAGPFRTKEALLAKRDGKVPKGHQALVVPEDTAIITCGPRQVGCPGVNESPPSQTYYYLFKYQPDLAFDAEALTPVPQMTGEHLRLSGTRADFDPGTGQPVVLMQFTDEGKERFHAVTRAEAQRGRTRYNLLGQGGETDPFTQHFAIVLDREIQSFPQIDFADPQLQDGIDGENGAEISGLASLNEAKDLALVLQTGALPVKFVEQSTTDISATLGEDSLREALRAVIAGMILVALFLLIAYRFLGLVAVIGLGIYAAFLYAVILLFDVTLTLPGFAGMILTIGVAADANIVIFERIKEESRAGKSVRAAIASGYAKGFNSIIDANVITALTAVVLFVLATAGVRGFALMLLIGTAMSIVTAVFATRAMLGLLAGFRWFNSPKFMGASGTQIASWIQHDYVGKRRIWFTLSAAVVAVAIGAIGIRGLNLGIDFEGGTEVSFTTPQPVSIDDVRTEAQKVGREGAVIQGVGRDYGDNEYREFQVRSEELGPSELATLRTALRETADAGDFAQTTVSATFGRQIADAAVQAIIFSLILVMGWIAFRFHWKFSLAVIVALIHDILIAIGIYAFTGKEVTTATVAALLTILGFSMYDSIIILDRVRENIPLMRRASMQQVGNVSLWETIRRSLATTFITLLPISALYFFGGETLKDFAFALLVGIGSGAYSSVFLCVPLVAWLKEREPEYARRRDGEVTKEEAEQIVEEATAAAADAPVPTLAPLTPAERAAANQSKRERRRQRRRTRPHGRAR